MYKKHTVTTYTGLEPTKPLLRRIFLGDMEALILLEHLQMFYPCKDFLICCFSPYYLTFNITLKMGGNTASTDWVILSI